MNDENHEYEHPLGVPRILVLGDSVTEAVQVPRKQNFCTRLKSLFRDHGRDTEIINAGVSGFGTDNEFLFFEAEGYRYHPDIVLLVFNLQNDIAENSPTTVRRMYAGGPEHPKADVWLDDEGNLVLDPRGFAAFVEEWERDRWKSSPWLSWLRANSFFARFLSNALRGFHRPLLPSPPSTYPAELDVYATPPDRDWSEAQRITKALLLRLRENVEGRGARLLVAIVPSRETVSPSKWGLLVDWFPKLAEGQWDLELPRREVVEFLTREGFAMVDTTPLLRERQAESKTSAYFQFDPHPNAVGHQWIAEAIFPALQKKIERFHRSDTLDR